MKFCDLISQSKPKPCHGVGVRARQNSLSKALRRATSQPSGPPHSANRALS